MIAKVERLLRAADGRTVSLTEFGEREIWFKTDKELLGAIAAIEAELNPQRPRNVMVRPAQNKGW